ncbi:MAG: haloacid dehalogenase-like hydrolase, partial [Bacilli bacterium]|nr:haloacid dehalogenase-like hydrolase [Bacilli bacterium]
GNAMNKRPICAILYDFDSTLAVTDMQNFGFIPAMGMTPAEFWGRTTKFSEATGCEKILSYLYVMNQVAKEKGIKMDEAFLHECGKNIQFFPGVLTWFKRINDYGKEHGVRVEHYLVSSGNKEIVDGCPIAKEFKVIYGCEYVFDKNTHEVLWPKLAINYTQKTQYFFRISKGVYDATDDIGVNEKKPDRRVPYSNMVYIGDGMTDIPSMIIVKSNGGKSIAVYPKGKGDKVESLRDDGRVNYACVADYSSGKGLEQIMQLIIQSIAINNSLLNKENGKPLVD